MTTKEDAGKWLITGIIAILTSVGFNVIDADSFENVYLCPSTDKIEFFAGGISGTGITGYPNEDNRKSPTYCYFDGGKIPWVQVEDYASKNSINLNELFNRGSSINVYGATYLCDHEKCVLK